MLIVLLCALPLSARTPMRGDAVVDVKVTAEAVRFALGGDVDLVGRSHEADRPGATGVALATPWIYLRGVRVAGDGGGGAEVAVVDDRALPAMELQRLAVSGPCAVSVATLPDGFVRLAVSPAGPGGASACTVRGRVWSDPARSGPDSLRLAPLLGGVRRSAGVEIRARPEWNRPAVLQVHPARPLRISRIPVSHLAFETLDRGRYPESSIVRAAVRFPGLRTGRIDLERGDTLTLDQPRGTITELAIGPTLQARFSGTAAGARVPARGSIIPTVLDQVRSSPLLMAVGVLVVVLIGLADLARWAGQRGSGSHAWTRLALPAVVPMLFASGGRLSGQQAPGPFVQSVRPNAVRVSAGAATGFGFIVGLGNRTLLIATAEHTLDAATAPPQVCFMDLPNPCAEGKVVYVDDPRVQGDPDLDLALIEVGYPDRLAWRPDVMGAEPVTGASVWFIGRNEEWYVPPAPGRVVASDLRAGSLEYAGLAVAEGVSGAPIVAADGIVGMHRESSGDERSQGVLLSVIRNRVEERLGRQWILVPRQGCGTAGAQAAGLVANRWVVVRFSWHRAAPAMETMARLRCAGALPLASPRWGTPVDGREIVYRDGDLRSARVLQTLLTPLGRIETRLGSPAGELEITLP